MGATPIKQKPVGAEHRCINKKKKTQPFWYVVVTVPLHMNTHILLYMALKRSELSSVTVLSDNIEIIEVKCELKWRQQVTFPLLKLEG